MTHVPPVLFVLRTTNYVGVTLQDLPDQDISHVKIFGIGGGRLRLGGVASDMRNEIAESIAHRLPSPLRVYASASRDNLPDLMASGHLIVVSQAFRSTVGDWDRLEYIPIELETGKDIASNELGGGDVIDGYYILNCWNRVDCVDWEKSTFGNKANIKDKIFSGWTKLILRAHNDAQGIFAIHGLIKNSRFISPDMARLIYNSDLKANIDKIPLDMSSRDSIISASERADLYLKAIF
ncbi:hypothetical protein [Caulobacter endophyticus]|uniref:hypothetical protein n=1 Tax=Caulobacter endophyticus TaxID=2172652 RepID=UPI0011B2707F|nr:hypothetical protein [Caulobacter endophyticus]